MTREKSQFSILNRRVNVWLLQVAVAYARVVRSIWLSKWWKALFKVFWDRPNACEHWVLDIMSPALLRMVQKNTQEQFSQNVSSLKFAPESGPEFPSMDGNLLRLWLAA